MSPNYQLQKHYWITMTHCRVLHCNEITHLISSLKKLKKFSLLFKCFYQAVNMTKNPFKSLLPSWKKESLAVHIIAEILLTTSVRGFYYTQEMQRPESFFYLNCQRRWVAKNSDNFSKIWKECQTYNEPKKGVWVFPYILR